MANRRFTSQFLYSFEHMPVLLEGSCVIDSGESSGVRSLKGSGIKAVSKLATGIYKVQLDDSYARYLGGFAGFVSSVSGNTGVGSISPGTVYVIRTVGTTTQAQWEAAGVPAGVVAAAGLSFLCAATTSGSGTCYVPAFSNVASVEVIGDPNLSITNTVDPHFLVATLAPAVTMASYTPAGSVAAPVFTGESYTPAGSNSAPALTMDSYTPAGTNDASSPPLFSGTPAVLTGSVAAPVFTGAAHTLAGTNSAPAFTGTPATLTGTIASVAVAPLDGSVLGFSMLLRNSSLKTKGE